MAIVKWDPLFGLDRIFEDDFPLSSRRDMPSDLSVDVYEQKGNVIAEMHAAGMKPEDVDVSVEDNYLRVSGRKKEEKEEKDKNYYYKEIRRGSFERTVRLPTNVKSDEAEATYEDGILRVVIPKAEPKKKKRKVKVKVKEK